MANFLVVADSNTERRAAFCTAARSRIAPLANLTLGEAACRDFHALWACGPQAPVHQTTDGQSATVIWGTPMAERDGHRLTADELSAAWRGSAHAAPPSYDGYFAAVTYTSGELVVGADILGLFPVFWWASGDVLLVGSSPELFKHHPLFHFEPDLAGLVGVLLITHSLGGHTLATGVKRLAAGHALVWSKGSSPREVLQYALPASTRYLDLPGAAAAELVNETLNDAVARHVPFDTRSTLTLTGGRDSRLLAGIMGKLGRRPVAVTFGEADDFEMLCAGGVARALGLDHHALKINLEREETCVELNARWLHCTTGFNSSDYWYCQEDLRHFPPYLVTGFVMDSIIGGTHFDWAYSETTREMSFGTFFDRNNRLAIPIAQLRSLLRPELFGTLLDDVISDTKRIYERYSPFESQRAWCFDLHHRQRFHVGTPPWQFSFGSWPVMPVVDKQVLNVTGGIPAGVLGSRRLQDEIFRTYYPALAELPLDRNGYDTTPIAPRLRDRIEKNLLARIDPVTRRFARSPGRGKERRTYYRLLDFNGPAWKLARQHAEPHRSKLYAFFNKDALDAILPPPEVDVSAVDGIIDLSGKRLLVGLSLWAGANL